MDSPDAARAQDVTSRRWSRWERSFRRACRDGRGHRGRGAHDRARRHERDGRRESRGPWTTRERLIHRRTKSWQPSSLSTISSVFLNNSLSPLQLPSFSLSLSSLSLSLSYPSPSLFPFSLFLSLFLSLSLLVRKRYLFLLSHSLCVLSFFFSSSSLFFLPLWRGKGERKRERESVRV